MAVNNEPGPADNVCIESATAAVLFGALTASALNSAQSSTPRPNHVSRGLDGRVAGSFPTFRSELQKLINRFSMEGGSNTPDFILADYLVGCLEAFDRGVRRRLDWQQPAPVSEAEITVDEATKILGLTPEPADITASTVRGHILIRTALSQLKRTETGAFNSEASRGR